MLGAMGAARTFRRTVHVCHRHSSDDNGDTDGNDNDSRVRQQECLGKTVIGITLSQACHTHTAIMTTATKMTMRTTRMTSHDGPQERRHNNDQYIANTNDDSGDEADGTNKNNDMEELCWTP